jgi:hypothetical protein
MKKYWMCVAVGVLVLVVPGRSGAQSDPTTRCKYAQDDPPSQIGPGLQQDADYNFAYVSDYEGNARTYRRRICSDSKTRVRFDWKLTGLNGLCESGGNLSNEIPDFGEPPKDHGDLIFDMKKIDSKGYAFREHSIEAVGKSLFSRIAGYVLVADKLVPVSVKFYSELQGKNFAYVIEVDAKQPVAVQVDWKEFAKYWADRQPREFEEQIKKMISHKILTANSNAARISINPGQKATWSFVVVDANPVGTYSRVEVFWDETKSTEPDLAGFAALYLPLASKMVASHQ